MKKSINGCAGFLLFWVAPFALILAILVLCPGVIDFLTQETRRVPEKPTYEELEERCAEQEEYIYDLEQEIEELYNYEFGDVETLEIYAEEIIGHINFAMNYFNGTMSKDSAITSLEDALAYAEIIIDDYC